MKVFIITPLSKGYRVDTFDPDTQEEKESGHTTRKNAIDRCLKEIPKNQQFQIVVEDGQKG